MYASIRSLNAYPVLLLLTLLTNLTLAPLDSRLCVICFPHFKADDDGGDDDARVVVVVGADASGGDAPDAVEGIDDVGGNGGLAGILSTSSSCPISTPLPTDLEFLSHRPSLPREWTSSD